MIDNSEPAFPQTIDDRGKIRSVTEGMSQHKLIAMHCLAVILANTKYMETLSAAGRAINMGPTESIITAAYNYATALLAKYEKEG